MKSTLASSLALFATTGVLGAEASSSRRHGVQERQSSSDCPDVHIIGAREPTADPGFGSTENVINVFTDNIPGATSEPLDYPAAGGDDYSRSVTAGIRALLNQTEAFAKRCPDAKMILIGYSQGAQVIDDVLCGGPDPPSLVTDMVPMPEGVGEKILAAIWMGNPRAIGGLPYAAGTSEQGGFAAREEGFECETYSDRIQSYCDSGDPFCSKGDSDLTHMTYPTKYGGAALEFVQAKLSGNESSEALPSGSDESAAVSWLSSRSQGLAFLAAGLISSALFLS